MWNSGRISAKEDYGQRSLNDKRAKHASRWKQVSKMEAQDIRIAENWIWKKKLGPHCEALMIYIKNFEYILRIMENSWVFLYMTATQLGLCFTFIA